MEVACQRLLGEFGNMAGEFMGESWKIPKLNGQWENHGGGWWVLLCHVGIPQDTNNMAGFHGFSVWSSGCGPKVEVGVGPVLIGWPLCSWRLPHRGWGSLILLCWLRFMLAAPKHKGELRCLSLNLCGPMLVVYLILHISSCRDIPHRFSARTCSLQRGSLHCHDSSARRFDTEESAQVVDGSEWAACHQFQTKCNCSCQLPFQTKYAKVQRQPACSSFLFSVVLRSYQSLPEAVCLLISG